MASAVSTARRQSSPSVNIAEMPLLLKATWRFRMRSRSPTALIPCMVAGSLCCQLAGTARLDEYVLLRSRGTPRVANRLLRRVRDYVQVHRGGRIDADGARAALELMGVDAAGLERLDRELLNALAVTFRGRPVGITTLAAALGEDPGTIEEVYEPYLLQRGLLERTPQGRAITAAGREHLGHPDTPGADARLFG